MVKPVSRSGARRTFVIHYRPALSSLVLRVKLSAVIRQSLRSFGVQAIRIPEDQWGKVWHTLVGSGPIACIGPEPPVYVVSDRQVRLLRRKKLPFEIVPVPNGREPGRRHA
jgi:hypothetical protein